MSLSEVAREALARVPTERARILGVPSSSATEAELQVVKDALDHLPTKVSIASTISSVASSLLVVGKVLSDAWSKSAFSMSPIGLLIMVAAITAGVCAIYAYVASSRHRSPLHERAKKYVDRLLSEQGPY